MICVSIYHTAEGGMAMRSRGFAIRPQSVTGKAHAPGARMSPGGRFSVSKNLRGKLFYPKTVPIFVSLRGRSAAVAILKVKAWHPVAKHGSTKQEGSPITKDMDSLLHSASSPFIYGSVSFRATIFRYGMTNRSVKDCCVGRTRPPRNDKFGRFCGKTEQIPERNV